MTAQTQIVLVLADRDRAVRALERTTATLARVTAQRDAAVAAAGDLRLEVERLERQVATLAAAGAAE